MLCIAQCSSVPTYTIRSLHMIHTKLPAYIIFSVVQQCHVLSCVTTCREREKMWKIGIHSWFRMIDSPLRKYLQRLRSPVHEAFSYDIFQVWPYASLNHSGISSVLYENVSPTGLRNVCIFELFKTCKVFA